MCRHLALLCLLWGGCAVAAGEPMSYHFKAPRQSLGAVFGDTMLSAGERRYLAGLPELRVALQRVGAPPYEVVGADGEISGYQSDLLAYLASVLGLKMKPVVYEDWPSVLRAVRSGEADMVLTVGVTSERMAFLDFTIGTLAVPTGLFSRPGHSVPVSRASYALEREYYINGILKRRYPQASVVPTTTTIEALRAVAEGRADYYAGSLLEALDMLAREPVEGIELRDLFPGGVVYYAYGLRKGLAPLAVILSRGIAQQRADIELAPLARAASALPASAALPLPLPLSAREADDLAEHPVWRVGAVRGLSMLNDVDAEEVHLGIAAEFTDLVARRLGVGVKVVPFDSVAAMLDGLRLGTIDVVPFLTPTPARRQEFVFSKPYMDMPYMLVARSDAPLYWDLASLDGRRLALAAQHPLREVLARRYPGIALVDVRDGNQAMNEVAAGHADAAVEVKLFANLRVNSDAQARLRTVAEVRDLPAQFSFAVAQRAQGLMPLIDRVLDEVPNSERERLLRRWVALDLNPPEAWRRHVPTVAVAAAALLLLSASGWWWGRRWAREAKARQTAVELLDDVGRSMPGVTFRYVLGPDRRLKSSYFSPGTAEFLGVLPGPQQTVLDAVGPGMAPEDLATARATSRYSLHSGKRAIITVAYTHPSGRKMWLHTEAVRSITQAGEECWTGFVVDVSSERALQERLAEEGRQRHLLLASASHELRAPTHTLSLALQAINPVTLPAESAQALRIARDASATLSQLLDDVLDTARFQAGKLELRPQSVSLASLVAQLRDAHAAGLAAKGLGFEVALAPEVPATACLDPLRIKQVLTNLLSNATKYTARGQVRMQVSLLPADAVSESGWLEFTVADTGSGIGPAERERLFEPFGSTVASAGSSGLGLSVTRRLVQLMGGHIVLDSKPGQGTTVRVRVPLRAVEASPLPWRREGVVLLCDDDAVSRMLVAQALAGHGLAVEEVVDGQAALARWRAGGVRMLVTDLNMPGLDGRGLIEAVRREEADALSRTAIIVCSGDPAPATNGTSSGHDAFVAKPMQVQTLIDTIRALAD